LAQTLVNSPPLLILDEPTEGLDPNQRNQIRKLIKKLSKKHTIIMSTHVMQEVTATCNRILIINHGQKVADDKKETLVENIQGGKKIEIELEGNKIKLELKKNKDINIENIEEINKKHFLINLTSKELDIERKLAQLAKKKDWIVLGLKTQEQDLEDIFRQLTEKK
jgi:ABC-2 type transport system ATP-binding protein